MFCQYVLFILPVVSFIFFFSRFYLLCMGGILNVFFFSVVSQVFLRIMVTSVLHFFLSSFYDSMYFVNFLFCLSTRFLNHMFVSCRQEYLLLWTASSSFTYFQLLCWICLFLDLLTLVLPKL
jgi:hypothetical protein